MCACGGCFTNRSVTGERVRDLCVLCLRNKIAAKRWWHNKKRNNKQYHPLARMARECNSWNKADVLPPRTIDEWHTLLSPFLCLCYFSNMPPPSSAGQSQCSMQVAAINAVQLSCKVRLAVESSLSTFGWVLRM